MLMLRKRQAALAVTAIAAAAFVGCQTYNFEPVRPLAIAQTTQTTTIGANAHKLEPNLMIVVDKSGSMTKPIDPSNPACPAQCGLVNGSGNCPAGCPTRISDLQDAMNNFLTNDGALFRLGLDELPDPAQSNSNACAAAPLSALQVNLPAPSPSDDATANQTQANSINQIIQRIVPQGGTPTAETLQNLVDYGPLNDSTRDNFVLLLTDGEPNCNSNNPHDCSQAACDCTFYSGVAPTPGACPGPSCPCTSSNATCVIGCLDADASTTSIQNLLQKNIRTIPVGFGAETVVGGGGTGFAPVALNSMAGAGGFARTCPNGTDAECNVGLDAGSPIADTCDVAGGQVCANNTQYCCTRKYFVALNSNELIDALSAITKVISTGNACHYVLEATPQNPSLLVTLINGADIPTSGAAPGTCASGGGTNWVYTPPGNGNPAPTVDFQGACCSQLNAPTSTLNVEFRIVQTL